MTDHWIKGRSPVGRRSSAGGAAELTSARFTIVDGTQESIGDHDDKIQWDDPAEWDDFGFPADFAGSTGKFQIGEGMDAEYHIDAFIQLQGEGDTSFTTGTMDLQIVAAGASVIEHQTSSLTVDTYPRASASSSHRIYSGGFIQIAVRVSGADIGSHYWFGSVVITKVKSIPPL